ncbi:hypothetical protein BD309DRAFT_584674 [Dichomitus squalens]|nr:hypothetical protein BD309DRAFT_584674 [Dichomitus squalens]
MSGHFDSTVITIAIPIMGVGWALCALGWMWELYKSRRMRRRLRGRIEALRAVMQLSSRDPLLPVGNPHFASSRTLGAHSTTRSHGTLARMTSLESSLATNILPSAPHSPVPDLLIFNTPTDPALPIGEGDIPVSTQSPVDSFNERREERPLPDPPVIGEDTIDSIEAESLFTSESTIPPSYHTRRSHLELP